MKAGASEIVRGQRDHADEAAAGGLPALKLRDVGCSDMLARMGAARAIFSGEKRTLDVDEGHHVGEQRVGLPRGSDGSQRRDQGLFRCGDQRREKSRGAEPRQLACCGRRAFDRQIRTIEVEPAKPVDLQVDQARCNEREQESATVSRTPVIRDAAVDNLDGEARAACPDRGR